MKLSKITYMAVAALMAFGATSCEDFLDRPAEDSYNANNYYANDDQCNAGVLYLYSSPWSDFTRGAFILVGETMAGNIYQGQSPYLDFSVNGTDENLVFMYESLWQVNAHACQVYNNIRNASGDITEETRNKCMGECLTLKALAYFYLVRAFGDIPIIHDATAEVSNGTFGDKHKVLKEDVYEYIIMTLEEAMRLLPKSNDAGRIDYYCAEGLLAKVYLTRSGVTGTRSADDLAKAAAYAKDVIDNSGRHLLGNYADVFRLANNNSEESLIGWRWFGTTQPWTAQNFLQSSLAMQGFDEFGDCWGGWTAPSVNLQDDFGVDVLQSPANRIDTDDRRKATMMMPGDVYEYFWQDKGGFNYLKFIYDADYAPGGPSGQLQSPTGVSCVKHLYGNSNDHYLGLGYYPSAQANGLATHILRLSDVYLVYAEAMIGTGTSTTDESAIDAYYAVRSRSIHSATRPTQITWEDVWKERNLELACEGDRWYDYVRLSYYDPALAISKIRAQRRDQYYGLDALYSEYFESGAWNVNTTDTRYNTDAAIPNITVEDFTLPKPTDDVAFNPNMSDDAEAVHEDVRALYSYE